MSRDYEDSHIDAEPTNELSERGGARILSGYPRRQHKKRGDRGDESASNHATKGMRARQCGQRGMHKKCQKKRSEASPYRPAPSPYAQCSTLNAKRPCVVPTVPAR